MNVGDDVTEETLKRAEEMGFECDQPELKDMVKNYAQGLPVKGGDWTADPPRSPASRRLCPRRRSFGVDAGRALSSTAGRDAARVDRPAATFAKAQSCAGNFAGARRLRAAGVVSAPDAGGACTLIPA
ncbi:hypothetical protein [Alienimonas chondri]|uniref:Nif11 domain-containing protein n=1 Tax=Alienimonas chondri TaxID=2681879 RepID=A0ABX1VCR4_9PLAN|nr:hypothetical protein [Alienimonas chondri]NNJ25918.1 hypothetical protein [Alienimonas chondri]